MKRTSCEMNPGMKADKPEKKVKGTFAGDPRLLPRIRQYLENNKARKVINVTTMSDELQARYSDYSRKKKASFRKSVEKAYEFVLLSTGDDQRKRQAEDGDPNKSDESASFSDDNPDYTTYEDKNAMNSLMRNFYMNPGSRPNSRPGSRPTSQPGSGNSSPVGGRSPFRYNDTEGAPTPLFSVDRTGKKNLSEPLNAVRSVQPTPSPKLHKQGISNRQPFYEYSAQKLIGTVDLTKGGGSECKEDETEGWLHNQSATDNARTLKIDSEKEDKATTFKAGAKTDDTTRPSAKKRRKQEPEESKKKGPDVTQSKVTFADIGGNDKMLADVCRLLIHLKHPEVYQQLGVTPPRGILLHGPPGCGKTLLAHAIAGELELPFIKVAATEIVSGVSGESEEKVRDTFQKAMLYAPCVLFIDEIDSITQKRENASKDMERRIVSQLLTCMDGLNSVDAAHVLVIGATNRPDSLDPALRRAGRFDREISMGIPDKAARERILRVLCRELRLRPDLDFADLASLTPGFVGADLMALAREAAITAVNRVFKSLNSDQPKQQQVDRATGVSEKLTESGPSLEGVGEGDGTMVQQIDSSEYVQSNFKANPELGLEVTALESNSSAELSTDNREDDRSGVEQMETNESTKDLGEHKTCSEREKSASLNDTREQNMSMPCLSGDHPDAEQNQDVFMKGLAKSMSPIDSEATDLPSVLSWLKDQPPLTDEQLNDLWIEKEDFRDAVRKVQPSAKREGFATIPDVSWSDIGALHDVREELQMAILAPVRHPEQFHALGLTTPPGILLAGPPGCGKTLLAKAVANESGINFISVKGPELLNMYVGESERAVRQVFQRARNSSPCVIFFDELDALCPKRSGSGEGGSSVRVVNQLLTEMDGLEERKQVFIMGATNRPDIIDPAILRPGRLDKTLYVGLPSSSDRLDILRTLTKNGTRPKLTENVDLSVLADHQSCKGYTGADLAALVREAAVTALREYLSNTIKCEKEIVVSLRHFETAFAKVKPSVTENDKKKYESMRTRLQT